MTAQQDVLPAEALARLKLYRYPVSIALGALVIDVVARAVSGFDMEFVHVLEGVLFPVAADSDQHSGQPAWVRLNRTVLHFSLALSRHQSSSSCSENVPLHQVPLLEPFLRDPDRNLEVRNLKTTRLNNLDPENSDIVFLLTNLNHASAYVSPI
jgi:hypothetical protein